MSPVWSAEDCECCLACAAADHDAAGDADRGFILFKFFCVCTDISCMVVPFKLFTVWFNAKSTNLVQLLTANDHLVIQLRAAGLYVLVLIILCH